MFVLQIIISFVLSMLASYGASTWFGRFFPKKHKGRNWLILAIVFIGISACTIWCADKQKTDAIFAAKCPKSSLVEFLIRKQREETQQKFKDDADNILAELQKVCYREDGDANKASDAIASFLQSEMQKKGGQTEATRIMMELSSPVNGKSLYECIEDYENIIVRTENRKSVDRADDAMIKGVREVCDKYPKIIEDIAAGREPELPPGFEPADFFNTIVSASTELLDYETVHKHYKEAVKKIYDQ